MAKFLDKEKAVSALKDLIKNADKTLILISPYLKLSKDFKELLSYRNSKDKITTVVFGKQELNPDEMKFLQSLRFVILKYNEDLHSKCYVNDEKMIITSLNLYEFSMANNKEMGVLIDKNDTFDTELFNDAFKEVDYINETSQRFELNSSKPVFIKQTDTKTTFSKPTAKQSNNETGYCIRTRIEIPFNVEKPMSYDAFKSWNKFADPDYAEKFCHFSGEPSNGETSVSRPILKKNWKIAKEIFDL
jgi:phosphatidylserine/phosphatidylglycerophosphate/cardiolipin synthase-like enzyme